MLPYPAVRFGKVRKFFWFRVRFNHKGCVSKDVSKTFFVNSIVGDGASTSRKGTSTSRKDASTSRENYLTAYENNPSASFLGSSLYTREPIMIIVGRKAAYRSYKDISGAILANSIVGDGASTFRKDASTFLYCSFW